MSKKPTARKSTAPAKSSIGVAIAEATPAAAPSSVVVPVIALPHPSFEPPSAETLHGSSTLASTFDVGGTTVQLGDIVTAAFAKSGRTIDEWNTLADDARDKLLLDELEERDLASLPNSPMHPESDYREGGAGDRAGSAAVLSGDNVTAAQLIADQDDLLIGDEFPRRELDMELAGIRKMIERGEVVAARSVLEEQLDLVRRARSLMDEGERGYRELLATLDQAPASSIDGLHMVRVTGPAKGRWRIGQSFGETPRSILVDADQLAALQADAALKVEVTAGA